MIVLDASVDIEDLRYKPLVQNRAASSSENSSEMRALIASLARVSSNSVDLTPSQQRKQFANEPLFKYAIKNNHPDVLSQRERNNRLKQEMNYRPSKVFNPFNPSKIKIEKCKIVRGNS